MKQLNQPKSMKHLLLALIILLGFSETKAQILLQNNFDTSSAPLGTGWVNQVQAGSMPWARATFTSRASPYSGGPYSGAGMCFYDSYNQNVPGVSWLISPAIATSTITSGNSVTVSFWALRHSSSSSSTEMRMSVWVGNTNNRNLATPLDSVYAHNSRYPSTTVNGGWVRYTYTVPSTLLSGANLFFFFRANTDWWNNFFMDEIVIQGVSPMAYSQTIVSQASTNAVIAASTNNPIIVGKVVTTGSVNPFSATSITFNTLGTTNVGNISNAKCYFTGNSPLFNTSQQFGSTITTPSGSMVFTGNTLLSGTANTSDTNYFWLTYDLNTNAPALNVVNGSMSAITINSISRTPSPTSNPGAGRIIRIPNVPSNVPINGLVGYWPFSGNAFDSSFNGNNGIVNGATLTTDRNGNASNAYYFSGLNCDTRIDVNVNTSSIQSGLTMSVWAMKSGIGCYNSRLLEFYANDGPGQAQWYWTDAGDYIFGSLTSNSTPVLSNFSGGNNNVWTHLVYTNDGSFGRFYQNGILINTIQSSGFPILSGNGAFGRMNHPSYDAFNGKMDDIGIWNRALTQQEIRNLYNPAGIFIQPKNIVTKTPGAGSFIVQTLDSGVTYQWQTNTGSGFTNLSNGGQFSGVNNDTLLVNNIQQSNNNQQFRCLTFAGLDRDTSTTARIVIPNVPNNVPVNGLVGYWPFTGNAIDSSGNGNNLTVNNASLTNDRNSITNSAYSFNGLSSSLSAPFNLETSPGVTISIWGNVIGNQNIQTLLNLTSANQQAAFGINYSQNAQGVDAYASPASLGSIAVNKNVWNHYVITSDNATNTTKFYCNGVLIGTSMTPIDNAKRTELNIGRHHSDSWGYGWFFNGRLDDIGIWNRALTDNEIKRLYNPAGIFVQPKNIVTRTPGAGSFIVQTIDTGVIYQWQTNTGSGFTNLSNGGQFSGVNNDTLLVLNILQSNQNHQFRCLTVSGTFRDTSTIVKIVIPNVPSNVPLDGLVGYWPFTGNAIDSSGYGNNGTVNGATLTTDRNGIVNRAYSFNGSNSYISVPRCVSNDFTIEYWMKTTQVGNTGTQWYSGNGIVDAEVAGFANDFGTSLNGNKLCFGTGGATDNSIFSTSNINTGNWVQVVVTREQFSGAMKIYINGIIEATGLGSSNTLNTPDSIRFGTLQTLLSGQYFNGQLDRVSMWNRALTQTEIRNLYNPASIFVQPKNIVTKTPGAGSFFVQTADSGVTYQWQTNTGSGFTNISNGGQYVGVNNDTLLVSNILQSNNNQQFRCLTMSGLDRDTSSIANINILNLPVNLPIDGLIGYWPFTGNAFDSSFNGNNGTVNGASLTTDRNAISNKAYSFNGSFNFISVPNSNSLNPTTGITISAWIRANSWGTNLYDNTIVGKDDWTSGNTGYVLRCGDNGKLSFNIARNFTEWPEAVSPSGSMVTNTWYFVTGTFDGTQIKVYINGNLVGTTNSIGSLTPSNVDLMFGMQPTSFSRLFNGSIDDIGIWNRALTPNEIKRLYNPAGIFVQPKNIVTKAPGAGSFIVQTADSGITYQWQTNTGSGFTNITNGGQYAGVNNDTLVVTNILQSNHNQQFRCLTFAGLDRDTSTIARIIIPNVPQYVSINGLLGWWPFTGNAIDSSGNGYNGTVHGATLTTDRKGSPNKAYSFNGTNNLIALPRLTGIANQQKVTFSFWENLQNQGCVFSQWSFGNPSGPIGLNAKILNNGSVNCEILAGIGQSSSTGLFTTNTWNHIVIQFDGTKTNSNQRFSVFVNGLFQGNFGLASTPSVIGNQSDSTVFGAAVASPFWDYLNGKLDDIGIWNRILTQEEISNLYISCDPKSSTFITSACSSFIWAAKGNKLYTASNTTDTVLYKIVGGCDSIVTLNLTIKLPTTSTSNISICSSALPYTWNGRNYTANAIDTIKLTNAVGCDSITILRLTVRPTSTSTVTISICASALPYTWNSRNYTANAVDTIKLINAVGCDSITILRLTVRPTSTSTSNVSICPSALPYTWNGRNYTASAVDTVKLINAVGCDSVTILRLTVRPTSTSTANISICSSALPYTWNSKNYTANAIDTIILTNSVGCDSVTILQLTVKPTSTSTTSISICPSALPYTWNGRNYTASSVDTIKLINAIGCDSVTILKLTVNPTPVTSAIAGLTNVARLDTASYNVTGLSGSAYNWNAQGATIETGAGSNKIRVKWQTMGTQEITVTETSDQGCIGIQKVLSVNVGPATGAKEHEAFAKIEIYPNPTTGKVNIKVDAKIIGSNFTIIDVMGKTVMTGTIKTNEELLNLENVHAGIYFINVGDNLKQTFKIIKE